MLYVKKGSLKLDKGGHWGGPVCRKENVTSHHLGYHYGAPLKWRRPRRGGAH